MEKGKAKFAIGERVLCFEPDQSKARVLYDAKILDADFVKESKGKKETEYKIHFQGWNSTWDRWAGENFVLKDTQENRKLQKKLAKKAIKKLKTYGRKKVHLPGVAKVIKKCSDPLSSDSDSCSESDKGETSDDVSNFEGDLPPKRRRRKSNTSITKQNIDASPCDAQVFEDLPSTSQAPRRCPPLEIPPSLCKRLEEDNTMIKKRNKLVELPAKLTVVQILENYAKYFALYVAKLPSSEKMMKSASQPTDEIPPEKNLGLCKETCQELRVLFDFILPVLLLYNSEQQQYQDLNNCSKISKPYHLQRFPHVGASGTSYKFSPMRETDDQPETSNFSGDEATMRKELASPSRRKSGSSKPTKIPPHHRKTAEEQIIEETHTYLIPHQPNLDRTGLANDSQGRRRSSRLSHHLQSPRSNDEQMVGSPFSSQSDASDFTNKGQKLRMLYHSSSLPNGKIPIVIETVLFLRAPLNHTHGVRNEKGSKSPLPLLCRDDDRYSCFSPTISLKQMCQEVYVGSAGDDVKKAVQLSQTWKFCLFPLNYEPPDGASVPHSLVYGIHHLLRLFVKLPQVFSKMDFPDFKVKIIYRHIHLLLKFLSEYENEIYAMSGSYVNASMT